MSLPFSEYEVIEGRVDSSAGMSFASGSASSCARSTLVTVTGLSGRRARVELHAGTAAAHDQFGDSHRLRRQLKSQTRLRINAHTDLLRAVAQVAGAYGIQAAGYDEVEDAVGTGGCAKALQSGGRVGEDDLRPLKRSATVAQHRTAHGVAFGRLRPRGGGRNDDAQRQCGEAYQGNRDPGAQVDHGMESVHGIATAAPKESRGRSRSSRAICFPTPGSAGSGSKGMISARGRGHPQQDGFSRVKEQGR